jgi:polyisoprenoid-binding protein YceI
MNTPTISVAVATGLLVSKLLKSISTALLVASFFTLTSCEKAEPVALVDPAPAAANSLGFGQHANGAYVTDGELSTVLWKGYKAAYHHEGSFDLYSKGLTVGNHTIKSGTFHIPIASIKNFDLPEHVQPVLLDHLKSADFFNMLLYPEATFKIRQVLPYTADGTEALPGVNCLVLGDFSMLGITNAISFPASIRLLDDKLQAEAIFSIDRTRWGMTYAADPALGDFHIYPMVDLHLKLTANRQRGNSGL